MKSKNSLTLVALESRNLFSAAPAPAPAEAPEPESAPVVQEAPATPQVQSASVPPPNVEAVPPPQSPAPAPAVATQNAVAEAQAPEVTEAPQPFLSGAGAEGEILSEEVVNNIAEAASQRWQESGLTQQQSDALASITYQVENLTGNNLAFAEGTSITIDSDAAGSTWFLDATPDQDGDDTIKGFDLLSVILHEQGHVLGLLDNGVSGDLMNSMIGQGERRLPVTGQAADAIPGSIQHPAFITSPLQFATNGQSLGNLSSTGVAVADLNGDGHLDAVFSNGGAEANRVWLNRGNGTFQGGDSFGRPTGFGLNTAPTGVAIADLSGDGIPDVAISDLSGSSAVYKNNGAGQFEKLQILTDEEFGHSARDIAIGQLNGNDLNDVVTAHGVLNSRYHTNNTGGLFGSFAGVHFNTSYDRIVPDTIGDDNRGVAIGDLDGDGKEDIVFANDGANTIHLNTGTSFSKMAGELGNRNSQDVAIGDLDGDGDNDLFFANEGSNGVWINDGSANFTRTLNFLGTATSQEVALGDLDGDGDLDAYVANHGDDQIWLNNGTGNFGVGPSIANGNSNGVALGDFDGDGDLDAIIAKDGGNQVWINQNSIDLEVTLESSPETVLTGNSVTYDVVVRGSDAVRGAQLTVNLSPHLTNLTQFPVVVGGAVLRDAQFNGNQYTGIIDLPASSSPISPFVSIRLGGDVPAGTDVDAITSFATITAPSGTIDSDTTNNTDGDTDLFPVRAAVAGSNEFVLSTQLFPTGATPSDGKLGDLDGDGDLDLFITNSDGPSQVWKNNGNGTFTNTGQALASNGIEVELGDINGDGHVDAFVLNATASRVLLNDGSGIFSDGGQFLTDGDPDATPVEIELGDLNSDGDLDATVATNTDKLLVFENIGNATFTRNTFVAPFEGTDRSIRLGDIDGSGYLNIALPGESSPELLADFDGDGDLDGLRNGSIVIRTETGLASGQELSTTPGLVSIAGDIDADGDLDIYFTEADGTHGIWLNNGSANFTKTASPDFGAGITGAEFGDVDGDGDLDLFLDGAQQRIWLNQNPVDLSVTTSSDGTTFQSGDTITYTIDIEGDATRNVDGAILSHSFAEQLSNLQITGTNATGGATSTATISGNALGGTVDLPSGSTLRLTITGTAQSPIESLATSRTTLEVPFGFIDTTLANNTSIQSDLILPVGSSLLGLVDSGQGISGGRNQQIQLADLDGDGDLDLGIANDRLSSQILINNGGVFTESQLIGDLNTQGIAFGDVDGDGDLDAVLAENGGTNNALWINNGSGNFSKSTANLGSDSNAVRLLDINSDGHLDALFGDSNGAKTFLGDGTGGFTTGTTFAAGSNISDIAIADIDNDGNADAVFTQIGDEAVWISDGFGGFIKRDLPFDAAHLALADFDNDGDIDFVASRNGANQIFLNDGTGVFSAGATFGTSNTSVSRVGDFNGDGHLDIASANDTQNVLWINDGSGGFTEGARTATSNDTTGLAIGDVNGDGRLDILFSNAGADNTVFLNQTPPTPPAPPTPTPDPAIEPNPQQTGDIDLGTTGTGTPDSGVTQSNPAQEPVAPQSNLPEIVFENVSDIVGSRFGDTLQALDDLFINIFSDFSLSTHYATKFTPDEYGRLFTPVGELPETIKISVDFVNNNAAWFSLTGADGNVIDGYFEWDSVTRLESRTLVDFFREDKKIAIERVFEQLLSPTIR